MRRNRPSPLLGIMKSEQGNSESTSLDFTNLHLYGRDHEKSLLQEAYQRSSMINSLQIVWLNGYSGVGKSTLVEHVFQTREYYCVGKFGRHQATKPYSALADILSKICFILEFESPVVELSADDASILARLVPEVVDVMRDDFEDKEVLYNAEWGLERVKQAVLCFLRAVCATLKSSLIMFLDDLQWADVDTLEVIKDVLVADDIEGLLFIGAYRENEVEDADPLSQTIQAIEDVKSDFTSQVHVANLDQEVLNQMVSDLTHMSQCDSEALSHLIHWKTDGNCFYALHMLRHIYDQNWLFFSTEMARWTWDEERIRTEVDMSDNVLCLLTKKLQHLPVDTVDALKLLSCLATPVILIELYGSLLSILSTDTETDPSILSNLLEVTREANLVEMDSEQSMIRFTHDRVAAAAYDLIPLELRASFHWRIGRKLQELAQTHRSSSYFTMAVNQLNRGSCYAEADINRGELARLNLVAAQQVAKTNALKLASTFLESGLGLLDLYRWDEHYDLTLQMTNALAKVHFASGRMKKALSFVEEIYNQANCRDDEREAQFVHVEVLACTNRLAECLEVGLRILKDLGHSSVPRKPGLIHIIPGIIGVKKLLRGMTDDDLLTLPLCSDPKLLVIMRHLGFLIPVAFFSNQENLIPVLTCRMMQITLQHGASELSPYALSSFGFSMTVTGDIDEASRFANLALKLMQRFSEDPRTLFMVHCLLDHLKRPIHEVLDTAVKAYNVSFARGDLKFTGQACVMHISAMYGAGTSLDIVENQIRVYCRTLRKHKQLVVLKYLLVTRRISLELMGRPNEMATLIRGELDDVAFESFLAQENGDMCCLCFWMYTMQARYYLGDMDSALEYGKRCWRSKALKGAFVYSVAFYGISALTALHFWRKTRKLRYWRIFRKYHRELQKWVKRGNLNTRHLVALLDAELLVVARRANPDEFGIKFDRAISLAHAGGFTHDAALANERAGLYLLANRRTIAQRYLTTAKELYTAWHATAKVQQMDARFGDLSLQSCCDTYCMSSHRSSRLDMHAGV